MNTAESFADTMLRYLDVAARDVNFGSLTLVHSGVTLTQRRVVWLAARKGFVQIGKRVSVGSFADGTPILAYETHITYAGRAELDRLYAAT